MNFRVSARTIIHLGSELISSDGIAFYELIKNALDAGATRIDVDVTNCLAFETYDTILRAMGELRDDPDRRPRRRVSWRRHVQTATDAIDEGAPGAQALRERILQADDREAFLEALRTANTIEVGDDGEGMSRELLEGAFMTIGTSHRAAQKRRAAQDRLILGEKGLGRLSAMRLGDRLSVTTGPTGTRHWSELNIDWNDFADAADEDVDSVAVAATRGQRKEPARGGTLVKISALRSEWSAEKLESMAGLEFSKLADPFSDVALPLRLTFNGDRVAIPRFASFLLDHAHGRFRIAYRITDGNPSLRGRMEYTIYNRRNRLTLSALELRTMSRADPETMVRLGPFDMELFWFNRRLLTEIEGIGSLSTVRAILRSWAGGVSLYRDGYRVNPYGGQFDDWLDLDREAFSTSGFKLNRGQIVGRASISQADNPYLVDQTNREGLKDCPEKRAFVDILAGVVEIYRVFLVSTERDETLARRVTATEALRRFRAEDDRLMELLPDLEEALSATRGGRQIAGRMTATLQDLRDAAASVQAVAGDQEVERSRLVHLASVGLMIEVLAHELYRSTASGLKTIAQARGARDGASTQTALRVLDAQLKSLQKRLKVLDPLSVHARQTKEEIDLADWVREIVEGFANRNRGSRVEVSVATRPRDASFRVRVVPGMFVQVLENLMSNSLFWIAENHRDDVRSGRRRDDAEEPIGRIRVVVDATGRRILVSDDGPGIPQERRELVFKPFFTTKPHREGRGLGLYIAREIAEYHGGRLYLDEADEDGLMHTFVFEVGPDGR